MNTTILMRSICFLFIALYLPSSFADEYRPAYLELKQTTPDVFSMLWKVPAKGENKRLALYVKLPDDISIIGKERSSFINGAFISRSNIKRKGGLRGATITIDGLERVSTDVLVRIQRLDGSTEISRLTPIKNSFVVAGNPDRFQVAKTYLVFGVEHILQGYDHLLFVACLIFIAGTWRRILISISGFTIAHSITLCLAALGLIRLPIQAVEAVIALSIVFLAREIIMARRDTLTWKQPITVSSTFGLLHGFGFAAALGEVGLPQTEIPAALLSFNIGVEIGQVLFVVFIVTIAWIVSIMLRYIKNTETDKLRTERSAFRRLHYVEKPVAYGIGCMTMMWTIERMAWLVV